MPSVFRSTVAAIAIALAVVSPASAGPIDDDTIYAIFDQANMADIATGRLGLKISRTPQVRTLAQMVVRDHLAVQRMGRELAGELGLLGTPPDNDRSWRQQADALDHLSGLSGRAFDEAYLRHEIAYHAAVIEAIKSTLLPAIRNEKFRALVLKVLPGFEHHLAATKQTADTLGVSY